jgi:regulatory protein
MRKKSEQDPVNQAHNKALRLLGVRNRSSKEMGDRLRAYGYQDAVTTTVLSRLQDSGLLDDKKFAFERARAMGKGKGWGPRKLRWDLSKYGVANEVVDQAIEQAYGRHTRVQIMRRLVKKRFGDQILSSSTDRKQRGKAQRYLLGRGFEPEEVQSLFPAS